MKYNYLVWAIDGADTGGNGEQVNIQWHREPLPARNWEGALALAMASLIESCWRSVLIYEDLSDTEHRRAVVLVGISYVGAKGTWLDLPGVYELAYRDMWMALADINNQLEPAKKE